MSELKPIPAGESDTQPDAGTLIRANTTLVYDGGCPFCCWYVDHLSESLAINTIDAREDPAMVARLASSGVNIDRDMALLTDGQTFKGAEALHKLSEGNSPQEQQRGWFNKLHQSLFGWHFLAMVAYPVFRLLRSAYLRISVRLPIQ